MSKNAYCAAGLAAVVVLVATPATAQQPPLTGCWRVTLSEYQANVNQTGLSGRYTTSTNQSTGAKYYWYCPPGASSENQDSWVVHAIFSPARWTGLAMSILMGKPEGHQEADEDTLSGVLNNKFLDSHDPLEVGVALSYGFIPWNNGIVVAPFAEFDWTDLSIKHMFAGGQFLGTRSNWIVTMGAKAGVIIAPSVLVYGLAGGGWLNQDLNVNFATSASRNVNTSGFTLGGGIEYAPATWRLFGKPASAFFQYQHHWWNDAHFNMPTSSPGFNYVFKRDDDVFKLGLTIYLSQ